jgi:acyl-CoA thioesterase
MEHIEEVRKLFGTDRFAMDAGIEILEADKNYAKCRMPITPKHTNAGGIVMGGATYTLADFTFAIASNTGQPATVTMDSHISFLSGAKGHELVAEAVCIKAGNKTCCYDVTITDDLCTKVAVVRFNGFRVSDKPLGQWGKNTSK